MSYQIASLFHMYIDMGERIAGKQDRFSLIIEDPLRAPKIPPKYTFLAPPAERQRSFSNTDLSVVRLSVRPSVRPSVRQD